MPVETLAFFLFCLLLIPLASAAVVAYLGREQGEAVRWLSLGSTCLTLLLAGILAWDFAANRLANSKSSPIPEKGFQPVYRTSVDLLVLERADSASTDPGRALTERRPAAIRFEIGMDGLNVWLVLLTALLMVPSVLVSWKAVTERVNEFYAWLLVLQMAMTGVFLSFDVILFYVFFELTLVPLFFLIGIWGGSLREYAARKFFVYTLTGSLITLLGVLGAVLVFATQTKELTFSIPRLAELTRQVMASEQNRAFWLNYQYWIFLAMMVGFAVKVPLVPVHTWLPLAHTEAPTAGSVLLAGVLLKLGTYGFLRLCLPLAPDASLTFGAPLIGVLAVIGIIYGAFCALMQEDVKKLVAYSSVSHLGFCMLGLFALNEPGITGSVLQMINHGLSTGALFLLVGMLYERYHTRRMADYGGIGARLKLLAVFMVFITMSSVGLPGLNGFVGEVLVLLGTYGSQFARIPGAALAVAGALGVILGAWYTLTMLRKVFFGPVREPHHEGHAVADLDGREIAALLPIALCCLLLGVYPQPVIQTMAPEVKYVVERAQEARVRNATP